MKRRTFIAGLPALLMARHASALDEYPSKPVRLVVPFAAGGGPDTQSRRLVERLRKELPQPLFVENKVGAAGVVGATVVSGAEPDGYTLLLGASTLITQKLIQPDVKYDPVKSFTHITRASSGPSVMIVAANSAYRTVADVIKAAKAEPGTLNYASAGIGTPAHMTLAALKVATGVDIVHIPLRGSVDIVPSILRGDIQVSSPVASVAVANVQAGLVRALAVTSAKRLSVLPDVPTLSEALGNPDLVVDSWSGIFGPAGLSSAIVARLNLALNKALADPEIQSAFERDGTPADPTPTPAEFTSFVQAELAKYARIISASNLTFQQ